MTIIFWVLGFLFGLVGFFGLIQMIHEFVQKISVSSEKKAYHQILTLLGSVKDQLISGLLPQDHLWESVKNCKKPWGPLMYESFKGLRGSGSAVLPTLKRFEIFANQELESIDAATTATAQAYAQAFVCSVMIPGLSLYLYMVLPELEENRGIWIGISLLAICFGLMATVWIIAISLEARWGGLKPSKRCWLLVTFCNIERFLALVKSGTPADIAWSQMLTFSDQFAAGLADAWGYSVWNVENVPAVSTNIQEVLTRVGLAMKKAIYVSVMEGKPCLERVENIGMSARVEIQSLIQREINKLSTKALKPLFLCGAPGLMILLISAIMIVVQHEI